ncbi:MAG: hypothetical protein KDB22_01035, partial [Planctomycetales bacterium]|nr:hypothetical protein [Planctomycetales bacterium]
MHYSPLSSTISITQRFVAVFFLVLLGMCCGQSTTCLGQAETGGASVSSSIDGSGAGTIIVEAHGRLPDPPTFFTAKAQATAEISQRRIEQTILLNIKLLQGKPTTYRLGLNGDGNVLEVQSEHVHAWSIRNKDSKRFLDLQFKKDVKELAARIKILTPVSELPATVELAHITPGDSVGFESVVAISYAADVEGALIALAGFDPLESTDRSERFQSSTGGQIQLQLNRRGTAPAPVELLDTELHGSLHPNGQSVHFKLQGKALVSEPDAELTILSGKAAISQIPADANYRLKLSADKHEPVYQLIFNTPGEYSINLDFVASLDQPEINGRRMDFSVAASAVIPLTLDGLEGDLEFHRDQEFVVPRRQDEQWVGYLPANGRVKVQWKVARKAGEGKLFFTTSGLVETQIGAGLLRQEHKIDFQVLQGELKSCSMRLHGPGEILDVQGANIVSWKVNGDDSGRTLDIVLSQPITGSSDFRVRSQTALGAFPIRVEGMRLDPTGAIRHSGYLRISNLGSVRIEPTGLNGLTQLAPDQFPSESLESRQVYVYRFPASDHAFSVAADRIQPEVNVSELVLYQLTDTDRVIIADIELDVREAPIREWDSLVPADYSVVAVTGTSVADYVAATESENEKRNLKVIFGQDVVGRQLIQVRLERSENVAAGDWVLPRIDFPTAKSLRGDIGIVGAAGIRVAAGATDLLVEKPLSYFPKPTAALQQAFRIREPQWSATMQIELLDRSVQSDVLHLLSLSEETVYGSALINYFVTGSPVSEWQILAPESLGNVMVDGQDVRTWRREGDVLTVTLHQPVMGAYTLLITYEEKPDTSGTFRAGQIEPTGVQGERGYIQVVSPTQVEIKTASISSAMLELDPLELPAEFRLLSNAAPLGTWQYTERPFDLNLTVNWFQTGTTTTQIVEFSEANSRVSKDGELVTDVTYYVKSRGQLSLKIKLPDAPVRLWEVSVNGQPVTARQSEDATLIPLPGGIDPNAPVEVSLRLGKPSVDASNPELVLPIVFAPVLKTQWNIVGDEQHVLVPIGGTVVPPVPVLRPTGFAWVAKQGLVPLVMIVLLALTGVLGHANSNLLRTLGLLGPTIAIVVALVMTLVAFKQTGPTQSLAISLPVLATGESVQLLVKDTPQWQVNLSLGGLLAIAIGLLLVLLTLAAIPAWLRSLLIPVGVLAIVVGVLSQRDGAPWFYGLIAVAIALGVWLPNCVTWGRRLAAVFQQSADDQKDSSAESTSQPNGIGPVSPALILLALALYGGQFGLAAEEPAGFEAADAIEQQWDIAHRDSRLTARGTIKVSGRPGDRFLLLNSPAVLTNFTSDGLRLTKRDIAGLGLSYIVNIPLATNTPVAEQPAESENESEAENESELESESRSESDQSTNGTPVPAGDKVVELTATFEYQLEAVRAMEGIPLLTGAAALQTVDLRYDDAGWDVVSPNAYRIESLQIPDATQAKLLLAPGKAVLRLKPQARDVSSELAVYFVESSNLYLPGPGVVDGQHRIHIRPSQGQVGELNILVREGLTVSSVDGPVGGWQFDADSGNLKLSVEPAQSQAFDVMIETQRSLDPLPTDVRLAPVKVVGAAGEVGLLGVAFGPEAQPEKLEPSGMSTVNLSDFDNNMLPAEPAILHRVYRYGSEGGEVVARVVPVQSEVRVLSKQVLSLGDERIVLGVNFVAEIARAGLFQLSFTVT